MAHLVPSDLSPAARCGWFVPERETLNHLRARLSAEYTVFHGVHWTREERAGTRPAPRSRAKVKDRKVHRP